LRNAVAGRDITIYGDGLQTRTFCYIHDNIEATIRCLNEGLYINDVVNLGSDREITIKELARMVIELTGSSSQIVHLPPLQEGDMRRRCPDNSKMRKILGHELTPLESGLKIILDKITKLA
jgi:UDP-glucose 4-epimerase